MRSLPVYVWRELQLAVMLLSEESSLRDVLGVVLLWVRTKRGQIYLNNEELAFALSCQVAKPDRHMGDGPDYKPRA